MFGTPKDAAKTNSANEDRDDLNEIKDAARRVKYDARDAASTAKDDVEQIARRSGEHMRDLADSAGNGIASIGQVVTTHIRDKPVQSSVVALGVGLALGMLFSRR